MKYSTKKMWILVLVLSALLALTQFLACDEGDGDSSPYYGQPAADVDQSDCYPGTGDNAKAPEDECDTKHILTWDGAELSFEHICLLTSCGTEYEVTFITGPDSLKVYMSDTNELDGFCTCPIDMAYSIPLEPGEIHLTMTRVSQYGQKYISLEVDISLPEGEERTYEF